jgi:hypothetical protein
MKKSLYFLGFAMMFVAVFVSTMNAYPRRFLVEDHSGAWCGWCPRGIFAADNLLAEFQDNFIPVVLHNGDSMATTLQSTIANAMGIQGYPTGIINRVAQNFNGGSELLIDPDNWAAAIVQNFPQTSPVNVEVTYNLDKQSMKLTATVKATFDADVSGQLAFNLYVMEDDMTGTGTGWDQHNYLTGLAGYENNPFYNLPSTVTNFKHENVMHTMLGGAFGINGSFPATGVKAGDVYTQDFTFDLNTCPVAIQNINKVWFVGLVERALPNYEILNSVMVNKTLPRPVYHSRPVIANNYLTVTRGKTTTQSITFSNYSKEDLTVNFTIDKNQVIPTDWNVTIVNPQAVIKSGQTATVNVQIQAGSTASFAQILVDAQVVGTDTYDGATEQAYVGALSDGLDYLVNYYDGSVNPLIQSISTLPQVASKTAFIPYTTATVQAFGSYPFKLAIIPESFNSRGALLNNDNMLNYLNSYVTSGKPLLITSVLDMFYTAGNVSQVLPDATTKTFFNTTLGITGPTQSSPLTIATQTSSGIQLYTLNVNGVTNDITNGWSSVINQYSSANPYYTYWVDQIKILDPTKATPILNYVQNGLTETTAAVKIQTATNRDIYMGFSFDLISDKVARTTLLGNMITWLLGSTSVDIDNLNNAGITVSPNPVNTTANVQFTAPKDVQNADIYLVDINGNRVKTLTNGSLSAGEHTINLNNSTLSSGKYYIITNLDGIYSEVPVIIEK